MVFEKLLSVKLAIVEKLPALQQIRQKLSEDTAPFRRKVIYAVSAGLTYMRYAIEAVLLLVALVFFRLLPLDIASSLAGLIAQLLGPLFSVHHTAAKNIEMALPDISVQERRRILSGMWNNLGRVLGEYPHLSRPVMKRRITVEGIEHLQMVKESGKSALFVSGHFANLEIAPLTAALCGLPLMLIYRAANNPVADWLLCRIRKRYNQSMYRKGREGAHQVLKALNEGQAVGMLIDQKMNDGEPVRFFGREAMTATAATALAIKLQVPLLMARVVRTDGAYFHVSVQPPILYDKSMGAGEAMYDLHRTFEDWIREYPAQWFWVHRRWGS